MQSNSLPGKNVYRQTHFSVQGIILTWWRRQIINQPFVISSKSKAFFLRVDVVIVGTHYVFFFYLVNFINHCNPHISFMDINHFYIQVTWSECMCVLYVSRRSQRRDMYVRKWKTYQNQTLEVIDYFVINYFWSNF